MFSNASTAYKCHGQVVWEWGGRSSLGAIIQRRPDGGIYKLIVGPEREASWYGEYSPNATTKPDLKATGCTEHVCLHRLDQDPGEHVDLSGDAAHAPTLAALQARMKALEATHHPPVVSPPLQDAAFCAAASAHSGFSAPYCPFSTAPAAPCPGAPGGADDDS